MPRTKLDKYSVPRTDPVKGLILAAGLDQHKSPEDIAKLAGVSRGTYHNMLNTHSDEWPLARTLKICKGLRIPIDELRASIRY